MRVEATMRVRVTRAATSTWKMRAVVCIMSELLLAVPLLTRFSSASKHRGKASASSRARVEGVELLETAVRDALPLKLAVVAAMRRKERKATDRLKSNL